jgi:hypothetical protein
MRLGVALCYHRRMSQPVKLSDALVLDARLAGTITERSIAGQVEFWAKLGRAVETLVDGATAMALGRAGAAQPLSALIGSVGDPKGRRRLAAHLATLPFPHYEPAPGRPGMLVRTEADGTRTVGRFSNRRFVAARAARR